MAEAYVPQAVNLVGMASEVANFRQAREKLSLMEADVNERRREAEDRATVEAFNSKMRGLEILGKMGVKKGVIAEYFNREIVPHSDGAFGNLPSLKDEDFAAGVAEQFGKAYHEYRAGRMTPQELYDATQLLGIQDPENAGLRRAVEDQAKAMELEKKNAALEAFKAGAPAEEHKKELLKAGLKPEEINLLFPDTGGAPPDRAPSLAQEANNAEIRQARNLLQKDYAGITPQQLKERTRKSDDSGFPNQNFDPYLARLIQTATQRMVGEDTQYEAFTSKYMGVQSQQSGGSSYINKVLAGEE